MEGVRKQVWKQGVRTFGVWNRVRKAQLLRTADPMEDDVGMFEIMPEEVAV